MPLSGLNKAVLGFTACTTCVGLVYMYPNKIAQPIEMLVQLQQTTAHIIQPVTHIAPKRSGKDIPLYQFTYHYTVAGHTYEGSAMTHIQPKDTIRIEYLRNDPGYSDTTLGAQASMDLTIASIIALLGLTAWGMLLRDFIINRKALHTSGN